MNKFETGLPSWRLDPVSRMKNPIWPTIYLWLKGEKLVSYFTQEYKCFGKYKQPRLGIELS